jgi:hypothetical protein
LNTVGEVVQALGIEQAVAVGDAEYDNLFIVVRTTPVELVRLRFP